MNVCACLCVRPSPLKAYINSVQKYERLQRVVRSGAAGWRIDLLQLLRVYLRHTTAASGCRHSLQIVTLCGFQSTAFLQR